MLLLILGLASRHDAAGADVRRYLPIFGYIATCVSMSERVSGPAVRCGAVRCGTRGGATSLPVCGCRAVCVFVSERVGRA